jgi:hypothetical protein
LSDTNWLDSDGKTPEEITKQVLAITQIVPGQNQDKRFSIPSRKSTTQVPQADQQPDDTQKSLAQSNAPSQSDAPPQNDAPVAATAAPKEHHASEETRDVVPDLADLNINAKFRPTPPGPVRRQDSQTNDIDEFHDAKS